jgi:uncharacterized protein
VRAALLALMLALPVIGCVGHRQQAVSDAWDPEAARLFEEADAALGKQDFVRARALMERAAATGEPEAINGLALYVSQGVGADPDPVRGRALLEQAFAKGSVGARLNLGCALVDSNQPEEQERGVALLQELYADPPEGEGKAATRRMAAGGLAKAYLFGVAVDEDIARGVDLLEEADASADADPQILFLLGRVFESGWGGRAPDSMRSYLYFMRAAQKDHAPSQWKVGMALLNESGAKRDEREAYRWVRRSADGGYLNGQLSTAVMLALGQGVAEDDVESRAWYERAANRNSAHALRGLGSMLLTGEGGPRDPARGLAYVQLAADAGDENAVKGLEWSRAQVSDAERRAAEEIAAKWLREHGKPVPD